jgi:hypothetical protein
MGMWYRCVCVDCGLEGEVSAGPDRGRVVATKTGFCTDCESLIDYIDEFLEGEANVDEVGTCPNCNSLSIREWREGLPCPKCAGDLRNVGPLACWD